MHHHPAQLAWRDNGTPVSTRFDDPYFSLENGLAETRHTFLAGNGLPGRLCEGFHVGELGFGTGLNLLAFWQAAREAGVAVRYTGFEGFPMSAAEAARALEPFAPAFPELAEALVAGWPEAGGRFSAPGLEAEVIAGDARTTLPDWTGRADAWFLDGFSPAKNPELWEPELMAEVARHTAPGGTFATYTAAGHVRRALEAAGFDVARAPGYGRKRHMSRGTLSTGPHR
ncbi:tRNA (5-methylaminomethyl-2-thiouridine)(34)-methyltransferase MnmD [Oceanicola sp. 502str15]|uniref:tRNA (5-methylaminomethyl-2-thiouridine)(34)-methyltransferase MnmD n=1 Tax=Oceanicola sp. 502str15 TaxID=2696061 RepID=UPI002095603D|nr:tRNA (5-methylaminomethyl-2-thiouridine)(34)-methyltransferase MnmD [Oceanicola sp. 502str15]MCO6384949.1 tRNA (5-methylaminomethyl-2-thiouridine)(34)-methyltransferase MnmD [Oceanicola sp. 502str15]